MPDPFRTALRAEIATVLTEQSITWPFVDDVNIEDENDTAGPYVSVEFFGGSEDRISFGNPGADWFREQGQATIRIVDPIGRNRNLQEDYANRIRNAFRGRSFTVGSFRCRIDAAYPMDGGFTVGGFWMESIALSYRFLVEG